MTVALPYLLIINYAILFAILMRFMRRDGLSVRDIWLGDGDQSTGRELLIGVAVAIPLTALNQLVLLPGTEYLQQTFGDYVAGGEVASAFGQNTILWFIVAGILAPLVEESIYRGYVMGRLQRTHSRLVALLIVTLFFGLLHWSQGFWPMAYTMVAGAIYAGVAMWRRNLIGATTTHSMFNVVEMISWLR